MMQNLILSLACISFGFFQEKSMDSLREKTAFQTSSPWIPEIDIRADVAIVYGVHGNPTDGQQELTFEERLTSWRERGYNTHFMTGIAWGSYQDYFLGEWDGKNHLGEGQVEQDGDTIWHGHNVPYIVTSPFVDYKRNYQATFVAQLLYPRVANYEVMPWPERIYTKPYRVADSDKKVLIPKFYSTQMQVMVNALNSMPLSENKVSGTNEIGVLMGNSLMFQRFPTHNGFEDPRFPIFMARPYRF